MRPEQVAALVAHHPEITRARVVASRAEEKDLMTVYIEAQHSDPDRYVQSVMDVLKLKGDIVMATPGSLPNDGLVIEDRRTYD